MGERIFWIANFAVMTAMVVIGGVAMAYGVVGLMS
jgi:hypothetical protein